MLIPTPVRTFAIWSARLSGFMTMPAMALVAPLAVLPVVSATQGAAGWSSVAVGQSVGAIGSILAGLDWPFVGPVQAVRRLRGEGDAQALYAESLWTRALTLVLLTPFVVTVCLLTAPSGFALDTALMGVAVSSNALTAAWYFEAKADARGLLLSEGIVRFGLSLGALPLVWLGCLWAYPVALLVGSSVSYVLNNHLLLGDWRGHAVLGAWRALTWRRRCAIVLRLSRSLGARLLNTVLYYGAVTIVAGVASGTLARFAAVDRVQKSGASALAVMPSALISVADRPRHSRGWIRRTALVAVLSGACSLVLGVVFVVALGPVLGLLYHGQVEVNRTEALMAGLGLALLFCNRCLLQLVWIPAGWTTLAFRSMLFGSIFGLGVLVATAPTLGVVGALSALVVSEVVVLALNTGRVGLRWDRWRRAARLLGGSGMQAGPTAASGRPVITCGEFVSSPSLVPQVPNYGKGVPARRFAGD